MFKFTPLLDENIKKFIENKQTVFDLVRCFSSPLNILFPQNMDKNIKEFNSIFDDFHLKGRIFYAHKCNKSSSLVRQALYNNINIDVASLNELKDALSNGFNGKNIEATGPKNDEFILLGIQQNIIFNIDNVNELNKILYYCKKLNKKDKVKILLRLNGFHSDNIKVLQKQSRFGIPYNESKIVLGIILENQKYLNFLGFAFHLDTVNVSEKVIAIENCLELFEYSYEIGLNPYVLDIGGGYKVNYLKNQSDWEQGISELKESIVSGKNNLTWNSASFGLRQEKGVLKGTLNIYNYFDKNVGAEYLREILSVPLHKFQNRTIGEILSENMIELFIEPGKSLLHEVGINIGKVNFAKKSNNGDILVGLDMKKSDLLIGEQEMFVDPIFISEYYEDREKNQDGVFLIGNLCMENDFIYKHKIFSDFVPNENDLVIFANTAGYAMDFEQSNTIMQKVARKIIIKKVGEEFKVFLDDTYNPFI